MRRRSLAAAPLAVLTIAAPAAPTATAQAPAPPASTLVSVTPGGEPGNGFSRAGSISADGAVVGFTSDATDLVAETASAPRADRAYVRDLRTGTTELVSRSTDGDPVDGATGPMSADGRYVTFTAIEDDVLGNGAPRDRFGIPIMDAFVFDRANDTVHHVSTPPDGIAEPLGSSSVGGISDDGRFVAVGSGDEPGSRDHAPLFTSYVVDRQTGTRTLVHQGRAQRAGCELTAILALSGDARRLVLGGCGAVAVDLPTNQRRLVPFSNRFPQVSADDGLHVAAGNLLTDVQTGLVRRVDLPPVDVSGWGEADPALPVRDVADGGRFALLEDAQGTLVWRDLAAARSVPVAGGYALGVLGRDGRWVAWSALGQVQRWGPAPIAPPSPPTPEGAVRWLYAHALNRLPSPGDTAYWAGQLRAGAPPSRIAAAIQRSPEGLERWVAILQSRISGLPDGDTTRRWRDRLAAGTPSVDAQIGLLVEFGQPNRWFHWDYVRAAYSTFLGRGPDGEEEGYWVGQLDRGVPRAAVLRAIAQSQEGRQHRTFHLYLDVLRRTPDAGGLAYWSNRLRNGDDLALRIELLASAELRARPTP